MSYEIVNFFIANRDVKHFKNIFSDVFFTYKNRYSKSTNRSGSSFQYLGNG